MKPFVSNCPLFSMNLSTQHYETAAKISDDCRTKGISAGGVDALICAIALARKFAIFSTDPDFQTYSKVLPLQLHSLPKRE
jgi:predicted nucleic acid-binding protein